jgi:hypothetical protein
VFGAVVVLLGAVLFMRPFLTRSHDVISATPVASLPFSSGLIDLVPGHEACVIGVTFGPKDRIARVPVQTYNKPGPALAVRVTGDRGYSYSHQVAPGYPQGSLDVPLEPPPHSAHGTFCLKNVGTRKLALSTAGVGLSISRAKLNLDGHDAGQVMPLTLLQPGRTTPLERIPAALGHAGTIWSLPGPYLWLIFLLVLLIPVGVIFAMRVALGAGVAPGAVVTRPARPVPLRRPRAQAGRAARWSLARVARIPAGWALAGLVALGAAYLWMWASRVSTWQTDENLFVYLARLTPHYMPQALWDTELFQRGIQRLEIFVLAVPLALMRSPEAFQTARAFNDLAFASTAVPIFLIARGVGASRGWALLAGFLSLAIPWTVIATSFLTETLGYPLCAWVLWAVWRAVVRPGIRNDLLAFALAFLAAYTRSGFLLLLPMLPIVVLVQQLRFEGVRRVPAAMWRDHKVLVALVGGGLLLVLLSAAGLLFPLSRLTGVYGTHFSVNVRGVLEKAAQRSAPIVAGAGLLPFVAGLPWLVVQAVRPRDPRRHAFAIAGLLLLFLVLYGSQQSGFDERYGMYLILPVLPALALAFGRREVGPAAVAAAGILVAVLLWRHSWNGEGSGYDFFVLPAETFYARVWLLHLQPYVPSWISVDTASLLITLALAGLVAHAVSRRAPRNVVIGLTVALVVLQLAQTDYAMRRFVDGAGSRFGPTPSTRAWIDRTIYGKGKATIFGNAVGNTATYESIWRDVDFWNTSVSGVVVTSPRQIAVSIGDRFRDVTVDPASGRILGDDKLTRYFAVAAMYQDVGLAGTVVRSARYVPVDLVKAERPVHARWTISGPSPDGLVMPGGKAHIRFFAAGLAHRDWCANVPLLAPAAADGKVDTRRFDFRLGSFHRTGAIKAGQSQALTVPLPALRSKPFVDGTLIARGGAVPAGGSARVSLQLGRLAVNPCASA